MSYVQYRFAIEDIIQGVAIWTSANANVYVATSKDGSTWRWWRAQDDHTLSENILIEGVNQNDAQAGYWTLDRDINNKDWAKFPSGTVAKYCRLYIRSAVTIYELIFQRAVYAEFITADSLSAITADLGDVTAGTITGLTITGGTIRTGTSGKHIRITSDGMTLHTGAATGRYGGDFKYGDGTKYGSGALAFVQHSSEDVPFYIGAEQSVADLHLYNRASDPSGAAKVGDLAVVSGDLKICTAAGTPGTFVSNLLANGSVSLTSDWNVGSHKITNVTDPTAAQDAATKNYVESGNFDARIKAWIHFNGMGTISISDSFNVTSITDNGTGDYTITWDTDFVNAYYSVVGMSGYSSSTFVKDKTSTSLSTGSARIEVVDTNAVLTDDAMIMLIAVGDQ